MIYSEFPLVEIFVTDGPTGIKGTLRGPRGPKNPEKWYLLLFLPALPCTHTHSGWKKLGGPPLIFNPRAHLDMGGWAQMSLLGSQRWIPNWSRELPVYEFSYFCPLKCDSMSFAESPSPPLLGLRRSYYPNETWQEVRAEVFCAPKIQMSVCFDQNRSQFFPVAMNYRQALLVSVSDFLFGFVSDTDTDTLNICQTKKTQKNSETVMLFRGRLHWLTVYVMRGRERELFLRWSRLDKLPPPRPCGFRAFIGGQHRETLRTSAVLSTFG